LSRSSAQITFRDESRLRLSANSQAVIQRMRVDPLSREEEAKVSLVEGDFYALLAGKSQRKSFELQVPDVQTNIDSTNFWVRRDRSGAKFTNYDEGILQVAAQGEEVTLGKNEGTVVRNGRPPSDKVEVLPPPVLIAPADDEVAFNVTTDLRWAPVDAAAGYWLEVGLDPGFRSMVLTRWGLKDAAFAADKLAVGTYYWRVVALDKFGLPGARSDAWRFHVRADTTPPYLAIGVPAEAAILRESPLSIVGESEPGVVLTLNGEPLAVGADGGFATEIEPAPGVNRLVLEAKDTAGNHTERARSFVFMPDQEAALAFDEAIPRLALRHFVTGRDVITLSGSTEPNAQIQIRAKDGAERASAYSNDKGRFGINVALHQEKEAFDIEVVAPSGFATTAELAVTVDRAPPEIALEAPPPAVTSVEWLPLRGLAKGAVKLLVNGRPAKLIDQSFDDSVTLTQGTNAIELVASDLVGNVKVEKLEVVLDQEPPELMRTALSRDSVSDGGPVTVDVVASDPSGVKQAAPFAVQIGNAVYTDFLKFNPSSKTYRATLILPKQASGRVALKDVELEDYAGNKKRYTFR
ncbi:MAG: FecR domain-containing protein, partial [Geminicoccaceae bacterium]